MQEDCHHDQGCDANRQVDQEHPAPAINPKNLIDAREGSTNHRPQKRRRTKDRQEQALVLCSLSRWNDVGDDGQRE